MRRPRLPSPLILSTAIAIALAACTPAAPTVDAPGPAAEAPASVAAPAPVAAPAAVVAMRAFGNEPFWEMTDTGSGKLRFTTPENLDGKDFPAARTEDAAAIRYVGKDVTLTIIRKDCSDGMSDATHPYTASMTLEGRTYSGCAAPASDVMPAEDGGDTVLAAYHANGFSPAWTADLKDDKLRFEVPDFAGPDAATRTVTVQASAYAKGGDYSGKDGNTDVMLSIKDGPCDKAGDENGKTGREFSATLSYGKTRYQGCADRR